MWKKLELLLTAMCVALLLEKSLASEASALDGSLGVPVAIPELRAATDDLVDYSSSLAEGPGVRGRLRSFEFQGVTYPDTSLHIPVSFVASRKSRIYGFGRYVNRVRVRKNEYGCQPDCSDAELAVELVAYASDKQSLTIQPGVQSVTSRNGGTQLGQGGYLGFRYSRRISSTTAFSIGGESIIHLDDTVDLGKNAYIGFSKLFEFDSAVASGPVVLNIGLGSGAFSLFGNSLISTGYRSDRKHLTADADNFDFGLVGSVSFSPGENLTFGLEYSGYGVGFGPSFRPIPRLPLVATFYIYDLLWEPDLPFDPTPNLFGNLTYRF